MADGAGASTTGRTGGQILVDQLKIHGVEMAFGVPGESYLAVIDALYDARNQIRFIVNRQEGGACNMAEAYGKLTGEPGICFVTRGPGATNASIGVHTAFQDSTPLILFIGQVGRDLVEREAFQEIDYRRMFGQMAKWVAEIDDARRIPEYVSHAFHLAVSGRPGPVVLALPEDMLTDRVETPDAGPYKRVEAHPGAEDMATLKAMLAQAERPFVIVGGGGWTEQAGRDLMAFAEANDVPVGTSFRCQDYVDNHHRCYAGLVGIGIDPTLAKRIKETDLLIVIGARLGEMTTGGYTLIDIPCPKQKLVHVYPGPDELGRVYQAELPINAASPRFCAALKALGRVGGPSRAADVAACRKAYEANLMHGAMVGPLDMGEVMAVIRKRLGPDAILANGAGNYATWAHRFYRFGRYRTQLAPTNGAMGYGVPAAIAAKLARPEQTVVCFAGDGCFLMTGQEMATAAQFGANVVFLVINNGMYGTIRMHQEREYPARVFGTELKNPDFAAYARSFGAHGEIVERTAEFAPAFERALNAGKPALIELRVDPESITPRTTLSAIREQAQAAGR
jgi:acetolactate synthase-1/2/3 large subunit